MSKDRRHTDWEKKFLRYLNKEMSSEERHAFEKELERDRFAYEAAEGFDQINPDDVADDLSQLRSRMQPWRKSPVVMWKIAAVITLMMVAGISAWRLTTSETGPVAGRTVLAPDSSVAQNKPLHSEEPPGEAEPTPAVTDSQPAGAADQLPLAAAQPPAAGAGPAQRQTSGTAGVTPARHAEDQMISEADEALSALSEDFFTEEEAIAEELSEGQFEEQAEAKPEAQKEALDDALAEEIVTVPTPVAKKTAASGSEAEERSATSVKKRATGFNPPAEIKDEVAPLKENAAPEMGWAEFERYVKSNQRKEAGMKRGEVALSFTLDTDGNPTDIEVVEPLCDICDNEAIRLLENSGRWHYYDYISGTPRNLLRIQIKK